MLFRSSLALAVIRLREATPMRKSIALLIVLSSFGCARLQQAPEPEKTTATETKSPVTPQAPPPAVVDTMPRFECSDGTIAQSFEACQINMARRRLPPAAQVESSAIKAADRTNDLPTGSVR